MNRKTENTVFVRTKVEFCVKLGKVTTEIFEMINRAYLEDYLTRSGVFLSYKAEKSSPIQSAPAVLQHEFQRL